LLKHPSGANGCAHPFGASLDGLSGGWIIRFAEKKRIIYTIMAIGSRKSARGAAMAKK
jgi:hypothetical protein